MMISPDFLSNKIHAEVQGVADTGFPLDIFPEPMQKIVHELVTYENFNLEYTASVMLSAYATAIGNTYHVKIKGKWETACAIYMVLVGRPGLGKTPPIGFLYKPIRDFDQQMLDKAHKEYDAYAQQQTMKKDGEMKEPMEKPRLVQTVISDFTQEAMLSTHYDNPRGIVLLVDEVVALFNSVKRYSAKSNLIEDLLSAYSGQPLKAVRKSEVFPICVSHPCINLIGGIQTNILDEIFKKEYVSNGLTDRFLFVFPKNKKIPKWQIGIDKEKRPDTLWKWTYYINKVQNMVCPLCDDGLSAQPKELDFSDEAMTYFYNWNNGIIDEVNSIEDDNEVESRKMKLNGNAARLSLILQVMRWSAGDCQLDCIDIVSVKGAIRLIEYFEDSYKRVKALSGIEETTKNQDGWLALVGNTFTSAEAEATGTRFGVSRRTVFSSLKRLTDSNTPTLRRVKQGIYEKIVKDCTSAQCTSALSESDKSDSSCEGKVQCAEVQSANSAEDKADEEEEGGRNE
jgi:hypothetical protein